MLHELMLKAHLSRFWNPQKRARASRRFTYQGRKVGNRRHDALDDGPSQSATRFGRWLMHDWTDPLRSYDGPDEEGQAGHRNKVCFDSEKVSDLVDWKPDCR